MKTLIKKENLKYYFIIVWLFITETMIAQGTQTKTKLENLSRNWVNPIANVIIGVLFVIGVVRVIMAAISSDQNSKLGNRIAMVVVAAIFWVLWNTVLNDLVSIQ